MPACKAERRKRQVRETRQSRAAPPLLWKRRQRTKNEPERPKKAQVLWWKGRTQWVTFRYGRVAAAIGDGVAEALFAFLIPLVPEPSGAFSLALA